jgi:hypothetical protein
MGRWPLQALWLSALGCADISGFDGNPQMDPGQDCLSCHSAHGAASGLTFTVAGTVYPLALTGAEGGLFNAEIDITGADNRTLTLRSNGAGNFYSAESVVFPAAVAIRIGGQSYPMQQPAPVGSCNACHLLAENPDGTAQPAALPPFALDAGFALRSPGRLYASPDGGTCSPPPEACPSASSSSSVPSYRDQVQAILESNCVACHAAGTAALGSYAAVQALGVSNLVQVGGCKMPPDTAAPMSPDERELLMTWLACGDPDN